MWNRPSDKQLSDLPKLYSTENVKSSDKVVRMHFFMGGFDWYIVEYDPVERVFFGYANLGDPEMAEWGTISLDELLELKKGFLEVDRDVHWSPKKFKDIKV